MLETTFQHPGMSLNLVDYLKGSRWHCLLSCALVCLLFGLEGCVVPTGKAGDQQVFNSEEQEIALGLTAWREVLKYSRLSSDQEMTMMVNRVGRRIAEAAKKPEYHNELQKSNGWSELGSRNQYETQVKKPEGGGHIWGSRVASSLKNKANESPSHLLDQWKPKSQYTTP